MSVLFPAFLFGAALVALPIVLHLLRRDVAPEVPFSAVRLLRKSPIARSHRRRLRDLLLLVARVTALLLLAGAFARPYVTSAAARARVRIVAIDRSFSMSAPGTFDRALQLARGAIDSAPSGARVAVVVFDDRAEVVAAPGTAADARASLAGLKPGFGATNYAAAIARAAEAADGLPGEVVVVTDMQRSGWGNESPQAIPSTLQLTVSDTGQPPANLAVVHVTTRPGTIVAEIRNTSGAPFASQVHASVDGREVASKALSVPAASTIDVEVPCRLPAGGTLAVSIDDRTGFAADNVRYSILDAQRRRVYVLSSSAAPGPSGFYVSRALDAAATAQDGFTVTTVGPRDLSRLHGDDLAAPAAIVLLSTHGVDRQGRDAVGEFVRHGGGLMVAAAPDVDPSMLSTIFDWRTDFADALQATAVSLAPTDLRHPIFSSFGGLAANLGQVRFSHLWRIQETGWEVAARFTDGSPALVERREGSGRVVVFASDIDRRWNDFPLHPAFVPFVVESVRYVARPAAGAREYLVADVPAGAPAEPGVFRVQPQNRLVAVNVDPRESATARLMSQEFDGMVQRIAAAPAASAGTRAQQVESRQNLWRYGLMLMLVTLVAEAFVGKA